MKSPFTGKEMELKKQREVMTFRGEEFSTIAHFYYCEDTKEEVTTDDLDDITINQIYREYRHKYNIPSTEEIIGWRETYQVSSADMAEILGFGANTYAQYEKGQVPSRSNGRLLQLIRNPANFRELVESSSNISEKKQQQILKQLQEVEAIAVATAEKKTPPLSSTQPS